MKKLLTSLFVLASFIGYSQVFTSIELKNAKTADSSRIRKMWYEESNQSFMVWDGLGKHKLGGLQQGSNTLTQDLNFDGAFNVGFGQTTSVSSFSVSAEHNSNRIEIGMSNVGGTSGGVLTLSSVAAYITTTGTSALAQFGSDITTTNQENTSMSLNKGSSADAILLGYDVTANNGDRGIAFYTTNSGSSVRRLFITEAGLIKLIPSAGAPTVGYVWTATNVDGSGSWQAGGGGGTPGGSNTQFQFNNSSAFGGAPGLTYNSGTSVATFSQIPVFTSGIGGATATTQSTGVNNTTVATTAFVQQEITANLTTLPLSLADGGAGSALSDPGANTIWVWDDTDNLFYPAVIGSGLTYTHSTHTLTAPSTQSTVTETKKYYFGEFRVNRLINTSTGATSSNNGGYDVTDYIEITPDESLHIFTSDVSLVTIYGWTYDASLTAISEIRSNALIGTPLSTYTFTTPSNAKYIQVYTRYAEGAAWTVVNRGWANLLRIESTATQTYNTPILPESFAGATDAEKVQAAFDFQRWTSSPVELNATYLIDTTLFVYSNTNLIMNGRIKMADGLHNNIIRNEAVKYPSAIKVRGNRRIKITGNGVFEGSDESWGGLPAAGVGSEWWRSIGLLLANVEIFEISGLTFKSTPAWAMSLESCRIGSVRNIFMDQDRSENNQDGLNLRQGCHNISINDIKGGTGDDLLALTLISSLPDAEILGVSTVYDPTETTLDIHHVNIKNIVGVTINNFSIYDQPTYGSGVLLLCGDGQRIHDVSVDNVSGCRQVRVGVNNSAYFTVQPTVDDLYNISFTNISSPIHLRQKIKNSSFINVNRLDELGILGSAAVTTGSLNVSRKYTDRNFEYFTTVPTFDPDVDISGGAEIWYDVSDAATITKSSNLVSQMTDKSGNGHTVTEATNKPLWVDKQINNLPVIRFDGTNDKLTAAKITALQNIGAFTAFLVGGNGTPLVWHGFDFSNRISISGGATPIITVCTAGSMFGTFPSVGSYSSAAMRIDGAFDGSASGNANRLRGFLTSEPRTLSFTGTIPATTENNGSSTFALGVINNASPVYFAGDFAEFILYTRVLTSYEISQVQNYLSSKWGL